MPYRRNYRKRPTLRRRRRYTRRRTMRRPLTQRALKVHHFKRTFALDYITSAAGSDVLGAYSFTLSQLPNYTEFTNLYDQYRINKILIKFVPNVNSADVAAAATIAQFNTVLDFNDATPLGSLNACFEYGNWRMSRGTQIHTRIFRPSTLDATSTSGAITATNPTWRQWISTANSDVPHFGLKYCAEPTAGNSDIDWRPYVTMYLSCKSVK